MQINDIKILVARLGAIVEGWDEQSGAPAVERHIAASLLAELYEAVKFDTALAATEVTKAVAEPAPVEESIEKPEEQVAEVIDLSDIFGGSFDDEIEEAEEPAEEAELEVEEEVAPEVEPEPEIEVLPEPEIEEEPISIEEEQPAEPEEEPIVEEEPAPIEEEAAPEVEEVAPVAGEEIAPAVEETPVVEEEKAPAVEETPEVEEEKPASKQASLFDMEVVRRPRSSSSRRVIMSLYGESTPAPQSEKPEKVEKIEKIDPPVEPANAEPAPAPAPIEEPASEPIEPQKEELIESATLAVSVAERLAAAQSESQPQILGEVIGAGTTTLAEAVAASQPMVQTVQNDRVNSLRNAIGINDRFILIRDLFGGDGAAFERAMDELDAFDDFNECLVYMSTYRWNPNSDGARMLMDLITRKLL
ncbi:MAG: hypothetical protein IKY65_04785 [Rikenellaceae bacterium]|nr:hypothetical protein [Rikenellaceae bacterium]